MRKKLGQRYLWVGDGHQVKCKTDDNTKSGGLSTQERYGIWTWSSDYIQVQPLYHHKNNGGDFGILNKCSVTAGTIR